MKKIAFYVEGQSEQFFVNKLLIEIAGQKNIDIELRQFKGIGKATGEVYPKTKATPVNPNHYALILDCCNDGGVKTRILEDYERLFSQGYIEVIGLRDLYPLTDLLKLENELINGTQRSGKSITQPLPANTSIIVAVREIEDWFLAEVNHFRCIDDTLTNSLISSRIDFSLNHDDLIVRPCKAATDLHNIYQLVKKWYNKEERIVVRTVECLDYANIYLNLRNRIEKLNDLITKIDNFLT